jgi:hypothetical protein
VNRLRQKQYGAAIALFLDAEEVSRVVELVDQLLLDHMTGHGICESMKTFMPGDAIDLGGIVNSVRPYTGSCDRLILLERYHEYRLHIEVFGFIPSLMDCRQMNASWQAGC